MDCQRICAWLWPLLGTVSILTFAGCGNTGGTDSGESLSADTRVATDATDSPSDTSTSAADSGPLSIETFPTDPPTNQPFQAQSTGISAPALTEEQGNAVVPRPNTSEILRRPFATIRPVESDAPQALTAHLVKIDEAIGDLVVAGSNNIIEKPLFVEYGMRLGRMKLETGQRLSNAPDANSEQRRQGVLATLIALSHMSGLGDVASAQQLETLARGMVNHEDPELAHQSRVVLLGFALQSLQNGLEDNPNDLLAQIDGLFQRPEDRNFPEFMMMRQAIHVLGQMGFDAESQRVRDMLIEEFMDSSDPQLRNETWVFAASNSQALANFNLATQSIASPNFDPQQLIGAARGLYQELPTVQTLEQLSKSIANIEYGGYVELSQQLANYIRQELDALGAESDSEVVRQVLGDHDARTSLVGKQFKITNLVDFDGTPINWSDYEGKVLLIDFWATWCLPCLKEIPNIREVYQQSQADDFAVIGVNMDENIQQAQEFIEQQNLPWKTFRFQNTTGFESDFAQSNGLNMIPFLVLVGKDGNVRRIHVRGPQIRSAVRDALGTSPSSS